MAYTIGNLEIGISVQSASAVTSITDTAKALSSLTRAIKRVNEQQFVFAGKKIDYIFEKIANSTNSINTANLTTLASVGKSLTAISKLGNLNNIDFDKVGKGFENLAVSITPFLDKVRSAETSLTSLYGVLTKLNGKKFSGILSASQSENYGGSLIGNINLGFAYAKLRVISYVVRRIVGFVSSIVKYGTDYTETLNLWQVAMKDNVGLADEFVKKMNKAYGISEQTLMNAQAIFKNMIGSLGQISDNMAYALSESITQMAIDYASLYNVGIDSAITKFQAALAGQVRPIRSVSGYDITENTLYQLYQSIGGEKSVRQLSRTEKQLLSILAIFKQMGASGALGDMTKTLDQFANQSRMVQENWKTMLTWLGISLQYLIQESGVMVQINALLITASEIFKAIAYSIGYEMPDFALDWAENVQDTADAVEKLQGKLLDFDKFRSLSGTEENILGIDEKLLEALKGYNSYIDEANNSAQQLADEWLSILGFTKDANGEFTITAEKLNVIKGVLKTILSTVGIIFGLGIISAIVKLGMTINTFAIKPLKKLSVKLVGWFQSIQLQGALATTTMQKFSVVMGYVGRSVLMAGMSFALFDSIISKLDGTARQTVSIISIIIGALATLLGVILAIKGGLKGGLIGASIAGLGVGALIAGIKGVATQNAIIDNYANGGMPDKGTVFRAGEAGAEIVYNTPSGKTGVANISQIAQADYRGTIQALNDWWANARNDIPAFREVSKTGIYEVVKSESRRRGE